MKLQFEPKILLTRALNDLRIGFPIAVIKAEKTLVILPIESAPDNMIREFIKTGAPELVLTKKRASKLKARIYENNIARIFLDGQSDVNKIRALGDPSLDLEFPLKGPLIAKRGGETDVQEFSLELMRKARLLPAVLAKEMTEKEIIQSNLTTLDFPTLHDAWKTPQKFTLVSKANLPLRESISSKIFLFRENYGGEEHCAIIFGNPPRDEPVLIRLHSACFTGDVLGSLKCDCRQQLLLGLEKIENEGHGVLLYVNQEGRGIGLINKIRAYSLQDQGFDTVEANHRLGFEDDERDFRVGSELLRLIGFHQVRIITNNPLKVKILEEEGIEVIERIPAIVKPNKYNLEYLSVKAKKSGHIL